MFKTGNKPWCPHESVGKLRVMEIWLGQWAFTSLLQVKCIAGAGARRGHSPHPCPAPTLYWASVHQHSTFLEDSILSLTVFDYKEVSFSVLLTVQSGKISQPLSHGPQGVALHTLSHSRMKAGPGVCGGHRSRPCATL